MSTTAALPSPPFIAVPGVPNFRDLGGHKVASSPSSTIRRGYIYRCGEPSGVTQDGIKKLQELNVEKAYDLRSLPEIERAKKAGYGKETEWTGCERCFAPVFEEREYDPESVALRFRNYAAEGTEGFTLAYTEILEHASKSYTTIFRHLLNSPDSPLIIHCTAGKDRTGVICAIILSLCGVAEDVISSEYSLTEIGLPQEWKETVIAHLMENPELAANPAGAWNLISARKENMAAFLKVVEAKYGGAEKYVVERLGFSKEEVEKIRSNLIIQDV